MIMYLTDLEAIQLQVTKKILDLQERKRKYDLSEICNILYRQYRLSVMHVVFGLRTLGIGLLLLS